MDKSNIQAAVLETTGGEYLATATNDWYEFVNGAKSDKLLGTTVRVVLPKRGFDRLNVKVCKPSNIDIPENGTVPVRFENLILTLYRTDNGFDVSARADSVSVISSPKA